MGLKSFLSGLFYKKNLKNIMIFLIALICLMLIFGNNNLVLSEGLTLSGAQAKNNRIQTSSSITDNQYENLENDTSGFANIEPFGGQNPITCSGKNNSDLVPKLKVNEIENNACLITKNIEAQI